MLRWMLPPALLVALILAAGPPAVGADEPATVREVASELISQCGSGMVLADHDCGIARSMKDSIEVQLDAGNTKEEILDYFVAAYGEGVLASPRKSGFGLTAWVTPLVAVAVGAVAGAALTWAWAKRPSAAPAAEVPAGPSEQLNPYKERAGEDLRIIE